MEIKIIVWGLLIVAFILGAILFVKSLRKPRLTHEQWMSEIERIFLKNGYSSGYLEGISARFWKDLYDEGAIPIEACCEYFYI